MDDVKIYIGVPTSEYARQAIFYDYLNYLERPDNTVGSGFHTNSAAKNRNIIINDALAHNCTHILFIDDDMAFAPNALMKLLKHDKDVVSGLYFDRTYPHPPVLFDEPTKIDEFRYENGFKRHFLKDDDAGLIEVGACGFGFLLVKTHIFSKMITPYVRHGQTRPDERNEDMAFCTSVVNAGFKIYCDLHTIVGHMGTVTFWPRCVGGKWFTAIDSGRNAFPTIPQPVSELEYV